MHHSSPLWCCPTISAAEEHNMSCCLWCQKILHHFSTLVLKGCEQHFACWGLDLVPYWRWPVIMFLLVQLDFSPSLIVMDPCIILCDKSAEKVLLVSLALCQKSMASFESFLLLEGLSIQGMDLTAKFHKWLWMGFFAPWILCLSSFLGQVAE